RDVEAHRRRRVAAEFGAEAHAGEGAGVVDGRRLRRTGEAEADAHVRHVARAGRVQRVLVAVLTAPLLDADLVRAAAAVEGLPGAAEAVGCQDVERAVLEVGDHARAQLTVAALDARSANAVLPLGTSHPAGAAVVAV